MADDGNNEALLPTRIAYDLWSETYDVDPNGLIRLERRHAMSLLDPQPGDRILDAGCGTGDHLISLTGRGARAIGVDLSLGMLRKAQGKAPSAALVLADLSRPLPFRSQTFDRVLCSLVSEHLTELDRFFGEMHRLLRPGGWIAFTGLHPDRVAEGLAAGFSVDERRYRLDATPHTLEDFSAAAQSSGLKVRAIEEAMVDADLVSAVPRVAELLGQELLFGLCAERPKRP